MPVELSSPEGMFQPVPYAHVAVATGSRHVHIAGQVARDAEGNHVATGDLEGQVAHVLRSVHRGLAGVGATYADVVRLRFFIVKYTPEQLGAFRAGIGLVAKELGIPQPLPPVSLIGVDALFEPDVLVELEAYAVLE